MIKTTIGRKVWYWPVREPEVKQFAPDVPCDATIIFPSGNGCASLRVTDHDGNTHIRRSCYVHDGDIKDKPDSSCWTWIVFVTPSSMLTSAAEV